MCVFHAIQSSCGVLASCYLTIKLADDVASIASHNRLNLDKKETFHYIIGSLNAAVGKEKKNIENLLLLGTNW